MKHELLIGKYTLESLTSGLYIDPKDLFREYIQNATDAFDDAVDTGLMTESEEKLLITIDSKDKHVRIEDNGIGVPSEQVYSRLIDIGNSQKISSKNRGFRGIGRLSGLGYSDKLIFATSAFGEPCETRVTFDAKLLALLLSPNNTDSNSIEDVISKVVAVTTLKAPKTKHYFKVEMQGVKSNGGLLNRGSIINYLQQIMPVGFLDEFSWTNYIHKKFKYYGVNMAEYPVSLIFNGESIDIRKQYRNEVLSDRVRRISDPIKDINFKEFRINNTLFAVLWYAETQFLGTVLDHNMKGIRVRVGNMLIGDDTFLRTIFKEERFNGWMVGELHIVNDNIIPNTRRDDFENNSYYDKLKLLLEEWAISVSKEVRHRSYIRSEKGRQFVNIKDKNAENLGDFIIDNRIRIEVQEEVMDDTEALINDDMLNNLSRFINIGKGYTKYIALNTNSKLTIEQRNTLEKAFDAIGENYSHATASEIIQVVLDDFS